MLTKEIANEREYRIARAEAQRPAEFLAKQDRETENLDPRLSQALHGATEGRLGELRGRIAWSGACAAQDLYGEAAKGGGGWMGVALVNGPVRPGGGALGRRALEHTVPHSRVSRRLTVVDDGAGSRA